MQIGKLNKISHNFVFLFSQNDRKVWVELQETFPFDIKAEKYDNNLLINYRSAFLYILQSIYTHFHARPEESLL